MSNGIGLDRTTLAIEELRGRVLALTDGRKVLPRWVHVQDVLNVIDQWEVAHESPAPSWHSDAQGNVVEPLDWHGTLKGDTDG